jgi:hypothetical protein
MMPECAMEPENFSQAHRCFRRVALASYLPPLGAPAGNASRVNNVTIVEAVARLCDTHLCNHLAKATLQVVLEPILRNIKTASANHGNTQHSFFQEAGRSSASATQMTE